VLSAPELGELIRTNLTKTAFRLETLDRYEVPTDGGDFARYMRGEPDPTPERKQSWADRLTREREAGIRRSRVHVLRTPLTDYLRFECEWGHALNAHLEDIRVLDLSEHPRPDDLPDHDYWLIDDRLAIQMHYDDAGRFLGAEVHDDVALYQHARDVAMSAAESFSSWWHRHPEESRHRAELSGMEAGQRAGMGQSKISKIERGALLPSISDVEVLCRVYEVHEETRNELLALISGLREEAKARIVLARGASTMQRRIGQLEDSATLFRSFQPTMVIGLLQTPAYMQVVFSRRVEAVEAAKTVAARESRQRVLSNPGKQFVMVMTEGALRWQAGSPGIMVEQIDAIIEVATSFPNVRIGIIPWTTAVRVFPLHGFHIYDGDAVGFGSAMAAATVTGASDVATFVDLFEAIEAVAVFGDEAVEHFKRIAQEYRDLEGLS
jgi:transcriptional regulator with XRE-family HTH domain